MDASMDSLPGVGHTGPLLATGPRAAPIPSFRARMEERERVERVIAAARDTKAQDMVLFDMDQRSPITDYVLICSGRSQAHVRGIADRVEEAMRSAGHRPGTIEGYAEGSWVLLDYDVLIVHVFHPETRTYYDLDGLLQGFPSERIDPPAPDPSPDDDRAESAA